jgi:asparagine synthase (glutamine-hydrolysing)
MCGIAGAVYTHSPQTITPESLYRMLGSIRHRGPDQSGIYLYQSEQVRVGLASARLSIIDLGTGQQPIANETGSLWIVFNGEIFNYIELRRELIAQGHTFATGSDTEVIIHLYEQHGPACLQYLNGQFAFAIWDEARQRLFMARDRLGVRPIYYAARPGRLLFASEIKALLCDPEITAELDVETLDQIFTYWSPLAPRTIFRGIQTLPPGHWLELDRAGRLRIEPYWQLAFPQHDAAPVPLTARTRAEYVDRLEALLMDAAQIRLRADVPVGAYLSGGLDSSLITALVQRHNQNRLETFSISFDDPDFDESPFQLQMAAYLGTHHHVCRVTHTQIGQAVPDVIWHTEVPLLRTSPVPLYLLSQTVRDHHFKVVLTGEGADEFLAGYNLFKENKIRRFWAREPASASRPLLLRKLYPYIRNLDGGGGEYLKQFFGRDLTGTADFAYSHAIRWGNTLRGKRFFSSDLRAQLRPEDQPWRAALHLPEAFAGWSPLARAQYLEITIFLSEYLLSSQGDRVAMAHSVEGRFPFLDYRVVEFCNQLPPQFKLRGLTEKYLLKQLGHKYLPAEIWQRPKRPYRAPIHASFFPQGQPLEWVAEMLSETRIRQAGYFDAAAVANLVKKLARTGALGETDDMALMGILSTQLVHEQFIEHFPPAAGYHSPDTKEVFRSAANVARPAAARQEATL